jgi:thioesterase domain-containing protein
VLEYHALVNRLELDQPVYAFQARGLNGEEVKDPTVETMAAAFLEELRAFQPHGPYYLGGFCLGGLLALEAAQQLGSAGEEVGLVVVIQSIYPESLHFKPSLLPPQRWWHLASKRISLERQNLSHRGAGYIAERTRQVLDISRTRKAILRDQKNGTRPADPAALSKLYIYESLGMEHKKAMESYRPKPYSGDVALFRASRQLAGLISQGDPYLGWKRVLNGSLDVCEIHGHQQNMLLEPNVGQLAKEITSRLNAAQQKRARGRLAPTQPISAGKR